MSYNMSEEQLEKKRKKQKEKRDRAYQKKKDFKVSEHYSAFDYSLFLVSRQDYSTHKLKTKLKEKEYTEDQIQEAIDKMYEYKYLDDDRFCHAFIRSKRSGNGWGANRIKQELMFKHGIKQDVISEILSEYEFGNAKMKAYIAKYGTGKPVDNKDYSRRMGFLARRGFSPKIPSEEEIQEYLDSDYQEGLFS